MKSKILISSCLLGLDCSYKSKIREISREIRYILNHYETTPICPEQLGGLSTPRPQQEIQTFLQTPTMTVKNIIGEDVTLFFRKAAVETYKIARLYNAEIFIGKSKSPSCGNGKIYDGSFTKQLIDGDGFISDYLKKRGLYIFNENDLKDKVILEKIKTIMNTEKGE